MQTESFPNLNSDAFAIDFAHDPAHADALSSPNSQSYCWSYSNADSSTHAFTERPTQSRSFASAQSRAFASSDAATHTTPLGPAIFVPNNDSNPQSDAGPHRSADAATKLQAHSKTQRSSNSPAVAPP